MKEVYKLINKISAVEQNNGKDYNVKYLFGTLTKKQGLTPRQAMLLAWRARANNIEYRKTKLPIIVQHARDRECLANEANWKLNTIMCWLTNKQKKRYLNKQMELF